MIDYLWNNKEWLFSGIGVSALVALIWIGRKILGSRRQPRSQTSGAPQPVSSEGEQSDLALSPMEIVKEIKSRPSYQQENAANHYVGLKVRWKLNVISVRRQDEKENTVRLFCNVNDNYPWITVYDVSLTKHPELKILRDGTKLWVSGAIASVQGHDIELRNADIG